MDLRELARLAQTSASQLSRIERGEAGASDALLYRLAEVLGVPVGDITRGEMVTTTAEPTADAVAKKAPKRAKKKAAGRAVPYPGTAEGAVFHYTPEEAAEFLPWSALQLRRKAYAREIPFNDGASRVTFTGMDIREISAMTAVRPLSETARPVSVAS